MSSTDFISKKLRKALMHRRRQAEAILEECDAVEEAWDDWDVDTLLKFGYINQTDAFVIRKEKAEEAKELEALMNPNVPVSSPTSAGADPNDAEDNKTFVDLLKAALDKTPPGCFVVPNHIAASALKNN